MGQVGGPWQECGLMPAQHQSSVLTTKPSFSGSRLAFSLLWLAMIFADTYTASVSNSSLHIFFPLCPCLDFAILKTQFQFLALILHSDLATCISNLCLIILLIKPSSNFPPSNYCLPHPLLDSSSSFSISLLCLAIFQTPSVICLTV